MRASAIRSSFRSDDASAKWAQWAEGSTSRRASNVSRARSNWPEWWYARPSGSRIEPLPGSARAARASTIAAWAWWRDFVRASPR